MCGIAGAFDVVAERADARVRALNAAQAHRGPDHSVVRRIGQFTLGNTRLAIQDPTPAGNQPFFSADGRYCCVFNGEIYNHRELAARYDLPVRTGCDGEIIPVLWAKLGPDALAELRGMYAIALADSLEERLYLARDPFGIKPLHWRAMPDGSVLFASEVTPLARAAHGTCLDPAAIAHYLRFGSLPADRSPFREVTAVPPNRVAIFDATAAPRVSPVLPAGPWSVPAPPPDLADALTQSVRLHLAADVPTALLLSGGVDSAAIAAVSRRLGADLDCFTVAVGGAADEAGAAARTARHYRHRFQTLPAHLDETDVETFFRAMQRPSIDGLNTYIVCRAVREAGFKVALSGLGADEAVGGYSHFARLRYLPLLRLARLAPAAITDGAAAVTSALTAASGAKLRRLLGPDGPRDARALVLLAREVLPESWAAGLAGVESAPPGDSPAGSRGDLPGTFGAMVAAEVAVYLQTTLLPDADAFSMSSSVELRVPFVDSAVFAAALAAAPAGRRPLGKQAAGLALHDPYLRALGARPKLGFGLPMESLLVGPLRPRVQALADPGAPVWSVVDRARAAGLGLAPPWPPGQRWARTWLLTALNSWLSAAASG